MFFSLVLEMCNLCIRLKMRSFTRSMQRYEVSQIKKWVTWPWLRPPFESSNVHTCKIVFCVLSEDHLRGLFCGVVQGLNLYIKVKKDAIIAMRSFTLLPRGRRFSDFYDVRGEVADIITYTKFLINWFRRCGVLTPQSCLFAWYDGCFALTTVSCRTTVLHCERPENLRWIPVLTSFHWNASYEYQSIQHWLQLICRLSILLRYN